MPYPTQELPNTGGGQFVQECNLEDGRTVQVIYPDENAVEHSSTEVCDAITEAKDSQIPFGAPEVALGAVGAALGTLILVQLGSKYREHRSRRATRPTRG